MQIKQILVYLLLNCIPIQYWIRWIQTLYCKCRQKSYGKLLVNFRENNIPSMNALFVEICDTWLFCYWINKKVIWGSRDIINDIEKTNTVGMLSWYKNLPCSNIWPWTTSIIRLRPVFSYLNTKNSTHLFKCGLKGKK